MYEEVFPTIHRIEVPLPRNPLKAVNCYVIKGPQRHLVIDTGMNRPECRAAMEAGLKKLDVDLERTDFFITHLHADHMGLVSHLASEASTVYFNRPEADMMARAHNDGGFARKMMSFARFVGFSDQEMHESLLKHPGLRYHAPDPVDFVLMDEGDRLQIGEFDFECIHTPGHSPGHLCLYDAEKKLMVCGDHVLGEISPNISAWEEDDDPLRDFLDSLDKVAEKEVELALPGHRGTLHDFEGRIEELKQHHHERLDEVLELLDGKPMVPYDLASHMTWSIKADSWDEVGIMQKWFATGEAAAHLHYLEHEGRAQRETQDGVNVFSVT